MICMVSRRHGNAVRRASFEEFTIATTSTKSSTTEAPELAQKFREQLVSTVQQGQQLSLNAAQAWVKAVSVIPVPDLPTVPGVPTAPSAEAATIYTFDLVTDLLSA